MIFIILSTICFTMMLLFFIAGNQNDASKDAIRGCLLFTNFFSVVGFLIIIYIVYCKVNL